MTKAFTGLIYTCFYNTQKVPEQPLGVQLPFSVVNTLAQSTVRNNSEWYLESNILKHLPVGDLNFWNYLNFLGDFSDIIINFNALNILLVIWIRSLSKEKKIHGFHFNGYIYQKVSTMLSISLSCIFLLSGVFPLSICLIVVHNMV